MIEVKYKGKDISDDVSIIKCYHDMYAERQTDTLHITFSDDEHVWDSWGVKTNDEIAIEYGAIKTGKMFVYSAKPSNGLFEIVATSVPASHRDKNSKAWQKVKLKAMCQEIAENHGLEFSAYGVDNVLYEYLMQSNESDFAFLNRRLPLEGCAFLVYDGKLVVYSEKYMEGKKTGEDIEIDEDTDYEYDDKSGWLFGSCKVEQGKYTGKYKTSNGSKKEYIPKLNFSVSSKADADRYAKNMLRFANKNAYTGYFYSSILTGYAPASMATISNERAPSWDGEIFITHVRNDYAEGKSKIFFRKPIEGGY